MARYTKPTQEQIEIWENWLAGRPQCIRDMVEKYNLDPWTLYLLKTSKHRVTLHSFSENGTVTVRVMGEFNWITHERNVFGINPEDLEPCELPSPDELLGCEMSTKEVDDNIDAMRLLIRPDIWENVNGKAVRRKDL